jgi:hypothetical protein
MEPEFEEEKYEVRKRTVRVLTKLPLRSFVLLLLLPPRARSFFCALLKCSKEATRLKTFS